MDGWKNYSHEVGSIPGPDGENSHDFALFSFDSIPVCGGRKYELMMIV